MCYLLHSPGNLTCLSTSLHFHSPLAHKHMHLQICSLHRLPPSCSSLSPPSLASEIISTGLLYFCFGAGGGDFCSFFLFFFFSPVFLYLFVCLFQCFLHTAQPRPDKHREKPWQSWKIIAHCTGMLSGAWILQWLLFLKSTIMSWESISIPWLHELFGSAEFANTG